MPKTINFRNCMIFMTSNAGAQAAQQYLDQLKFLPEKFQKVCLKRMPVSSIIKKVMQRQFDPEFINRIDRVLQYQPVQDDALPRLAEIELDKLRYGARHLARKIRVELEPILAVYFLNYPEKNSLQLDFQNQKLMVIE